jgi:hypothetical protein
MTAGHTDTLRKIVRDPAYIAAEQQICEGLPSASMQELMDGKFTAEELAIRQAFQSGALHSFSELNKLGRAPKSKKVHAQPKHFKPE